MKLKYELNDLLVVENLDKIKVTIRVFEILKDDIKTIVRAIDDDAFNIFESIFYEEESNRTVWYCVRYKKYRNYNLIKNKYIELSYQPNKLVIDINKKCFLNLRSGLDMGILKFEEIKLLSLNLHFPLMSNRLNFDKFVYIINKFIWSLEKTIPVDVYYRNNDFGTSSNGYQNFLKIVVIIPSSLIKRINSFLIVNGKKINILDLIKDVWFNTLTLNDVKLKNTKDLLSSTYYYNQGLDHGDTFNGLVSFLNDVNFSDAKTNLYVDILRNNIISKLSNDTKKLKMDGFLIRITLNKKANIEQLTKDFNENLGGNFNYIKSNYDGTQFDLIGFVPYDNNLPISLKSGYYLTDLFELDNKNLNFDLVEVLIGYDIFNFYLTSNKIKNSEKIKTAISNFALYISNSSNSCIYNLNKFKITHRTFY